MKILSARLHARETYEQPVQPLHVLRGVGELATFGQCRLLVEHLGKLIELLAVGNALEILHERMADIELERGL
jgi:hypothetical protein